MMRMGSVWAAMHMGCYAYGLPCIWAMGASRDTHERRVRVPSCCHDCTPLTKATTLVTPLTQSPSASSYTHTPFHVRAHSTLM